MSHALCPITIFAGKVFSMLPNLALVPTILMRASALSWVDPFVTGELPEHSPRLYELPEGPTSSAISNRLRLLNAFSFPPNKSLRIFSAPPEASM